MAYVCIEGATFSSSIAGATVVVVSSIVDSKVFIDEKPAYKNITFSVTLSDGHVGTGVMVGESAAVTTLSGESYILDNQSITVACVHPTTLETRTTTVSILTAGQSSVEELL